jgi:hypothetical protein
MAASLKERADAARKEVRTLCNRERKRRRRSNINFSVEVHFFNLFKCRLFVKGEKELKKTNKLST